MTNEKLNICFENILGKLKEENFSVDTIRQFDETLICHLEQDLSYFCISVNNQDKLKTLANMLKPYIAGSYLFIYIVGDLQPSICIGVNTQWFEKFINKKIDLSNHIIRNMLNKLLYSFSTNYSVIASRHLVFQKQYSLTPFQSLFLQVYALEFLHALVVNINMELNDTKPATFKNIELKKIIDIQQKVVNDLPKSPPSIKEMAEMVGMSVSKFKILFHQAFGESPHQYILEKKLIFARELLQTGQYSIAQVSYKVGFNHPSGFTRLFKSKFNFPPSAMYKNHG